MKALVEMKDMLKAKNKRLEQQTIELNDKLDKIKELVETQNDITDYDVATGSLRLSKQDLKDIILQIIEGDK